MDTTIDMIIRIKNGYMSKKNIINAVYSKLNEKCLSILKELGYIKDYKVIEDKGKKSFSIELKYINNDPALTGVTIISKPGRRMYVRMGKIKSVVGNMGISIISTSKGVMTNKSAVKQKLGGQILFEVW
jgi:small subunit ribosomal protein S8